MPDKPDLTSGLEEMEKMEKLLEAAEAGEHLAETEALEAPPTEDKPEEDAAEALEGAPEEDAAEAPEEAPEEDAPKADAPEAPKGAALDVTQPPPPPAPAPPADAPETAQKPGARTVYKSSASPPKPEKPPKTKEQLAYELAKKERFRQVVWQPFLAPIIALVSICLIASLLLGLTNSLTAPLIEANTASDAAAARRTLLPEADDFTEMDISGLSDYVTAMYAANNGAGWVVESWARGYGGEVPVTVAFGANGVLTGVVFSANNETPGLGQNIVGNDAFAAQFTGRAAENISSGEIDKIASATITTNAAVSAVNAAIEAYRIKVGGAAAPTEDPAEIRAALLPGESLTPTAVDAPNVQPEAFVSDAGNYIIYGEKPAEGAYSASPVVAAVAMDAEGVILNLWIDTSGEHEQYGQTLAANRQFLDSFIGRSAPVVVDAVTGVTSSSRSVMEAVNNALNALPLLKGTA